MKNHLNNINSTDKGFDGGIFGNVLDKNEIIGRNVQCTVTEFSRSHSFFAKVISVTGKSFKIDQYDIPFDLKTGRGKKDQTNNNRVWCKSITEQEVVDTTEKIRLKKIRNRKIDFIKSAFMNQCELLSNEQVDLIYTVIEKEISNIPSLRSE